MVQVLYTKLTSISVEILGIANSATRLVRNGGVKKKDRRKYHQTHKRRPTEPILRRKTLDLATRFPFGHQACWIGRPL